MILAAALLLVRVSGVSMEPTLMDGQFYHFAALEETASVERGAVVMVRLGMREDTLKVKRIAAVPSDTLRALRLFRPEKGHCTGCQVVPEGWYYITNDNPEVSGWTSRERGLIPRDWIRAVLDTIGKR